MRIASIQSRALAAPVERPLYFGIGPFPTFYATLVEITTDTGITGVGECIVRKAPEVTKQIVDEILAPVVIGRDPWDVEGLWQEMFDQLRRWGHSRGFFLEAISGVDIAIWDILGKSVGLPVSKILTGVGRERVKCYASSIYFADLQKMVAEAKEQVQRGHTALKVKIGRTPEQGGLRIDVKTVRAIREAVGSGIEIMVDANGAYDAATAIRVGRYLEELDVAWFEEPVPPDDLEGYARVRQALRIPIACGESEFGVFGFRDLILRRGVDILQPDIARIGGFTGARKVAALADAYHLAIAPHTGFSGGVCHLAALHFAAATPNFVTYEAMFIENPLMDIFTEPLPQPSQGYIPVPQRPGLGLDLDPEKIQRFTVS
ncbi:MAG: mandelate racemase/muconate lactonizing enzyme family protein [Armatimonadota bacterium]|nr:mandelate racemase/muconate lactonizing enzyme family protein [Armatimonadota bacterium]MDR5704047.1 mandelate racemase/muconate lactonizing enzyme family protein [Armatimonadota bacterium]